MTNVRAQWFIMELTRIKGLASCKRWKYFIEVGKKDKLRDHLQISLQILSKFKRID